MDLPIFENEASVVMALEEFTPGNTISVLEHCYITQEYGVSAYIRQVLTPVLVQESPELDVVNMSDEGFLDAIKVVAKKTWQAIVKFLGFILKKILPFIVRFFKWLFARFLKVTGILAVKCSKLVDAMKITRKDTDPLIDAVVAEVPGMEKLNITDREITKFEESLRGVTFGSIKTKVNTNLVARTTDSLVKATYSHQSNLTSLEETLSGNKSLNFLDIPKVTECSVKLNELIRSLQSTPVDGVVFQRSNDAISGSFMVDEGQSKPLYKNLSPESAYRGTQTVASGNDCKRIISNGFVLDRASTDVFQLAKECVDLLADMTKRHHKFVSNIDKEELDSKEESHLRLLHSTLGSQLGAATILMHQLPSLYLHVGILPSDELVSNYYDIVEKK